MTEEMIVPKGRQLIIRERQVLPDNRKLFQRKRVKRSDRKGGKKGGKKRKVEAGPSNTLVWKSTRSRVKLREKGSSGVNRGGGEGETKKLRKKKREEITSSLYVLQIR